jgi:predicted dehydrogenase
MSNIKVIMLGTSHPHIFHRYRYLQRSPNITPLGYYDSDAEVAQRMQGHAGCTRYENLDSLLALPYDVALIHGRDHENADYIRLALDTGAKGIFVEKPGVAQPPEFYPLAEEIRLRKSTLVFEVGWELHYLESVAFARRILHESLLGNITMARFHGGCPGGAGAEPWQSDPLNIGGFFYSLGGHVVEIVIDLFGLPVQVVSSIRKLPAQQPHQGFSWVPNLFDGREVNPLHAIGTLVHEDIASAILEYENFNVHLDFTAWEGSRYLRDWSMEIYGTGGSMRLNVDGPGSCILLKEKKDKWKCGRNELFETEVSLDAAFEKQMENFFRRVDGVGIGQECCDENIVENLLKLYSALYESARTRKWVFLQI